MSTQAPRDSAVDAILTAETLLVQFVSLVPRLSSALPADVSIALGEAQSLYPELWSNLDRAHLLLGERGIDVPTYDELRARQPATMLGVKVHTRERSHANDAAAMGAFLLGGVVASAAVDVVGSIGAKRGEANNSGLRDSRAALDVLRNAMPDVDWKAVRGREAYEAQVALRGLSAGRTKKTLIGVVGLAVAISLGVGLVKVLQHSSPDAVAAREKEAKDKAYRADQDEISELNAEIKQNPCNAAAAERRASLFVRNQNGRTGRKLAKDFLAKCGDNASIRAIANSR